MKIFLKTQTALVILLITCLGIFFAKLALVLYFGDIDWEPDSYMHFLEIKTIFTNFPDNLDLGLGVWTKPLYAYPFGLIVYLFGIDTFLPIQILNILIFIVIGLLVYSILRKLKVSFVASYLGFLFTNISFLVFRSSITSLTEPIFTLVLTLGFWCILKKRNFLAAVFVGLSVLGRIEGLLFVGVFGLYFLYIYIEDKKLVKLIIESFLLLIPTVMWNFFGYLTNGKVLYIFDSGYPTETGIFGFGSPTHYIDGFLKFEPILFIIFVFFVPFSISFIKKKSKEIILIESTFLLFLLAQMILWTLGAFGTAGLMRYFISVMPLLIICDTCFLEILFTKLQYNKLQFVLTILALVVLQSAIVFKFLHRGEVTFGLYERPHLEDGLAEAGKWIKENVDEEKFLHTDRPEVLYYSKRDLNSSANYLVPYLRDRAPGIYVWSKVWGPLTGISFEEISKNKLLKSFADYVYIYEVE